MHQIRIHRFEVTRSSLFLIRLFKNSSCNVFSHLQYPLFLLSWVLNWKFSSLLEPKDQFASDNKLWLSLWAVPFLCYVREGLCKCFHFFIKTSLIEMHVSTMTEMLWLPNNGSVKIRTPCYILYEAFSCACYANFKSPMKLARYLSKQTKHFIALIIFPWSDRYNLQI